MGIGANVRKYRLKLGLDQKSLASMIGVTPAAVSNYENDTSSPREDVLFRLFDVLQVTPDELFSGCYVENNNKKSPVPENTEDEIKVQQVADELTDILARLGLLDTSGDISDEDARVLAAFASGLCFYFGSRGSES